jgi:hypothetical protein
MRNIRNQQETIKCLEILNKTLNILDYCVVPQDVKNNIDEAMNILSGVVIDTVKNNNISGVVVSDSSDEHESITI